VISELDYRSVGGSMYLSDRCHASKLFVHITHGCGPILLWWRCGMFYGRNSGMDEVVFAHNGQEYSTREKVT